MELRKKRKEEIILAAMKVFKKNGLENSKMEDIAMEAGIGKGTIYGYFTSKKDLFEEMIFYNMSEYKKGLYKIVEKEDRFSSKLESLSQHHCKFISKSLDVFQIININKVLSDSVKKKFIDEQIKILDLIKEMLEKAIDRKEIRKDMDIEIGALYIMGGINQYSNKKIFLDQVKIENIDFTSLIDMIIQGIEKKD